MPDPKIEQRHRDYSKKWFSYENSHLAKLFAQFEADLLAAPAQQQESGEGGGLVAYASPSQIRGVQDRAGDEAGVYIPLRKTPAGQFTMPLYAYQPAQPVEPAAGEVIARQIADAVILNGSSRDAAYDATLAALRLAHSPAPSATAALEARLSEIQSALDRANSTIIQIGMDQRGHRHSPAPSATIERLEGEVAALRAGLDRIAHNNGYCSTCSTPCESGFTGCDCSFPNWAPDDPQLIARATLSTKDADHGHAD